MSKTIDIFDYKHLNIYCLDVISIFFSKTAPLQTVIRFLDFTISCKWKSIYKTKTAEPRITVWKRSAKQQIKITDS